MEPVVVDGGKGTVELRPDGVTRAARSVFSTPCAASRIALLGSNPVDRIIANFFLGVYPQPCPMRFFTSRTESMNWLQESD